LAVERFEQEGGGDRGAGRVIEARGLSKRFGDVVAVDDLSFDARPVTVRPMSNLMRSSTVF
jgi:hypothetical protein